MIPNDIYEAILYDLADKIEELIDSLVLDDQGRERYKAEKYTSQDIEMFNTRREMQIAAQTPSFDTDIFPDNFWNE